MKRIKPPKLKSASMFHSKNKKKNFVVVEWSHIEPYKLNHQTDITFFAQNYLIVPERQTHEPLK